MEHTLQFLNPQWHYGRNVTIRDGSKWYEKACPGDKVLICQTGAEDNILAKGTIEEVRYAPYMEVSLGDLLEEHDRECGTPFGLTHAMLRAYPDFTLADWVTIIRFKI